MGLERLNPAGTAPGEKQVESRGGPILEMRGVSKNYGSTIALHDVNLHVANGEFLTLLGPSGCGKTTILRLFSGFETPTRGELLLNGQVINDIVPEKRKLNTVFQNYALFPHMTVRENVAFGLRMQKRPKDEINRRVREALHMVHLENLADRRPAQLSGGQQQRVAIARAVINNPLVLLLDEPFSALDFKLRKQMQFEIKHLQRQLGITFVFVTHDQEEAFAMSDRVVVMNEGYIEQIGTPKEIYEEPESLFVARFVGEINILEGVILEVQENNSYLAEVEGVVFPLRTRREFARGEKVRVLLRPEDIKIYHAHEVSAPSRFLQGRINESVYKGATVDVSITLDNGTKIQSAEFFNEDDADISYNAGERVSVSWVAGWEVVLDHAAE
ncbi:MAG: spermidine/putrescine ABC transporter ATP-binding protein PotA [Deltaproteobacteria bacterium]|jgi:spermidine/putrescine transport system ATP-binding protein|nr:spermidine/putrescine ABC transporter ATP-binding protein PotA [Deltaproteobacteria bacterium]